MKQLIIAKNVAYSTKGVFTDLTKVEDGAIAIFNLADGNLVSASKDLTGNFSVVCGRGEDKMPVHFPEVDLKSLTVSRAEYTKGSTFTGKITIPTTVKGEHYTVIIAKCGVGFHERNRWTYTSMAKSTTSADVAADIVKQINANTYNSGVKATNTGGAITITAVKKGTNYNIVGADELLGVAPTDVTEGVKSTLDKEYIQDLASRCAAGKGFNLLADEGKEIYPGYPEVVADDEYVLYSLRFAVPRVSSKQRDEVVYQTLHIAVPSKASACTTLDSIFNLSAEEEGEGGDGGQQTSITSL